MLFPEKPQQQLLLLSLLLLLLLPLASLKLNSASHPQPTQPTHTQTHTIHNSKCTTDNPLCTLSQTDRCCQPALLLLLLLLMTIAIHAKLTFDMRVLSFGQQMRQQPQGKGATTATATARVTVTVTVATRASLKFMHANLDAN